MNRPGTCPNCGKDLGLFLPGREFYDTPFRKCPKCKKEYVDRRYKELAILPEGIEGELTYAEAIAFVVLGILAIVFGLIMGRYDYVNGSPVDGPIDIVVVVFAAICFVLAIYHFIIIKFGIKKKKLLAQYGLSVFRLSDPNYALKLKVNGFDVPDKYL